MLSSLKVLSSFAQLHRLSALLFFFPFPCRPLWIMHMYMTAVTNFQKDRYMVNDKNVYYQMMALCERNSIKNTKSNLRRRALLLLFES